MSAIARVCDLIVDHIRDNLLTTYQPAVMWDESERPFTGSANKIILARQEGRSVNGFVRVSDVQVWLFSQRSSDYSDLDSLCNDALAACDYVMDTDFVLQDASTAKVESVIEHVTGPYRTESNRYFYRFTVRVLA